MNDSEKTTNTDEMSHKGKKLRSYPAKMKVDAVKYIDINGNRAKNMLMMKREFETPCPSALVRCAPVTSPVDNFARSAFPAN